MLPSAQSQIAGESKQRSRWDQARVEPGPADRRDRRRRDRLRRRRGSDLGAARRRGLVQPRAAADPAGHRRSRRSASARARKRRRDAAAPRRASATATTRNGSESRVGDWLQIYFNARRRGGRRRRRPDQICAFARHGAIRSDRSAGRARAEPRSVCAGGSTACRATPSPSSPTQDPRKPGRSTALIQQFRGKPAIVAAVAVGTDADLAPAMPGAPIVVRPSNISTTRLLHEIGDRLQLTDLHQDRRTPAPGRQRPRCT